jgi:type IV secretory pathway VirB9-like protein
VRPVRSSAREAEPLLNRNYDIRRGWFLRRKDYPWIPTEVFDDGTRTYIVLPETAGTSELPILYELEGGNRQVLNYVIQGDTIVADRVLQSGVLVVGTGDGQREIEFRNRGGARKEEDGS